MKHSRGVMALAVAGATVVGLAGCRPALPPTDPYKPVDFTVTDVAAQPGAAFTVVGELVGSKHSQEIVTTSFNFTPPVGGPPSPLPGSVVVHTKAAGAWSSSTIVPTTEGIVGPNRPTIADVDGDKDNDVIVPAGYFFTRISPPSVGRGSITWWENTATGFVRHDVVTGVQGSYHSVVFADFDKDGVKDLVTTLEDGGWPSWPFGVPPFVPPTSAVPVVETQFLKGLGGGTFAAPAKIADGGGSLPAVFDIDNDGDYDVASAQYFKVKTNPIPPFGISNESFVWFEQTGSVADGVDPSDFTKRVIATGLGESFQIMAVDNIDGDGKYGAIGVNHTNPALGPPGTTALPQVVRLTPGEDVRAPWTVSPVADGFVLDDVRPGQAAPGFPSEGDLDGDGDIDLAVAGDADFGIYWLERKADGSWAKRDIGEEFGTPGTGYGQGSVAIADLNRDGKNELVFSSYNAGKVVVVERVAGTGGIVPAVPHQPDKLMPY